MQTCEVVRSGLQPNIPEAARILIVSDDDVERKRLTVLLSEAGFDTECAESITAGCAAAKSGKFQVVVSIPQLRDGSWKRLADMATHYDLRFEVVLWARNFDLTDWAEALDNGAFDVLDAVYEQHRIDAATKCALWAAYLKGAGPIPKAIRPHHKVA
jgi:DNA-binding NtrC family response regulator